MKLPWLVFPVVGVGLGLVSLLFLPRWRFFDELKMGLGIAVPPVLLFILVAAVAVAVDTSPGAQRAGKVALLFVAQFGAMAWVLSTMRIGW
jgi:hypothetical protein